MKQLFKQPGNLLLLMATMFFTLTACQKEQLDASLEQASNADASTLDIQAKSPAATKGTMTIGQIAAGNGNFTQLVDALDYTGLLDIFLTGTDQYTVFAPTDQAFMDLYSQLSITSIRDLPKDLVTNVLLYHVTDGRRFSNSVLPKKNMKTIQTLLDKPFYVNSAGGIDTNDAGASANASITTADISASNGVIHIINAVLLPE